MEDEHEKLFKLFNELQNDCFIEFQEINILRQKIIEKDFKNNDLEKLELVFDKWLNDRSVFSLYDIDETEEFVEFWNKKNEFFTSNLFYKGNVKSKGKIHFFVYAKMDNSSQATLLKYLSIV